MSQWEYNLQLLGHQLNVAFLRRKEQAAQWEPAPCPPDWRPTATRRAA